MPDQTAIERPAAPANGLDLSARITPGLFGVDFGVGRSWQGSLPGKVSASAWAETDGTSAPTWGALLKLSLGW